MVHARVGGADPLKMYAFTKLRGNSSVPHPLNDDLRHGGTLGILGSGNFDAFENIGDMLLSKEVLNFGTFGGLSFDDF